MGFISTLVIAAAKEGNAGELARFLGDKDANLKEKDEAGMTALHWAAQMGHGACVALLLEHGASPYAADGLVRTPLLCAAEAGKTQAADMLLAAGAMANIRDGKSLTALHLAAANGHAETAALLAQQKYLVDYRTKDGRTALSLAAEKGHADVARALVAAGADAELADDRGWNAHDYALASKSEETREALGAVGYAFGKGLAHRLKIAKPLRFKP